ncbi:MAG: hypothetical protein ABI594_11570 [Ginsengibacter sp.]
MFKQSSITIFLLLVVLQISFARQKLIKDTIVLPHKISKFIPQGYALIDTARGDINLDGFQDLILVLKTIGEDTALDATEYKRPLLLILGHPDKTFTLAARNDNIVYCYQCGGAFGDPYNGVKIKKGVFTVNHFGGTNDRWLNEITFKYSKADRNWYLFKIVDKGWNVFHLDDVGTTLKTKKDFGIVSFKKYNLDEE